MMHRRTFLCGLTLGTLAAPLGAAAQPVGSIPRVGFVTLTGPPSPFADAFRQGLHELGWIDGQNVLVQWRFAQGQERRIPSYLAEFVRLKVDVIVAGGGVPAARAAKQATNTIPIVFPAAADPVESGLVASLARPGGNVTGLSMLDPEVTAKRVQLLKDAFPKALRVAVVHDSTRGINQVRATEAAARSLGLQVKILEVKRIGDLSNVLESARKGHADAIMVLASGLFNAHREQIVEFMTLQKLPAMYEHREFPDSGGLMSYGPNIREMYRRTAHFVDRILKGVKPADLPVEQPAKFELVINLKAAKALGLTIPQSLLLRADEVIQ